MSFLPYGESGPLSWSIATGVSVLLHVVAAAGIVTAMQGFIAAIETPETRPDFVISLVPLDADTLIELIDGVDAPVESEGTPVPDVPEPVEPEPVEQEAVEPDPVEPETPETAEAEPIAPETSEESAEPVIPEDMVAVEGEPLPPETADPDQPDAPEAAEAIAADLQTSEAVAPDTPEAPPAEPLTPDTAEAATVAPPDAAGAIAAEPVAPAVAPEAGPILEPIDTGPLLADDAGSGLAAPIPGDTPLPGAIDPVAPRDGATVAATAVPVEPSTPEIAALPGTATSATPEPDQLALLAPEPTPAAPTAPSPATEAAPSAPQTETTPVAPETQAVEGREVAPLPQLGPRDLALADLITRIRDADSTAPPCLLTLPRRNGEDGIGLAMIASEDAAMANFADTVLTQADEAIIQTRTLIDPRQCAALDYMRLNQDYPASRLGIRLESDEVLSGRALAGVLRGIAAPHFMLLLIDNNGVVQDLTRFASVSDEFARFEVPMTRMGSLRDTAQLVLAVASTQSLDPLRERMGRLSQDVFAGLPGALADGAALGMVSFRMR
ncbi:hypothetical protein [Thetidibacter halocola]|uniref:Uncharacterized protein n=1 Tax=Thetidibacter halocola TaxID=2827239 RepID=A0A8J7W9S3_9RHOB|nr:hypothetical protein [Thetidibacter halocola]MBS0123547.1 hypothetical protein [Thetidibacter halocola]